MQILTGHVSPETAFVVDDYPYGFRLRCKIRYWIEYKTAHGFRFVSQTTNPKRPGEVWNKPKASTYCRFGAAMFLDENDHVHWAGLTEYSTGAEAATWSRKWRQGVPEAGLHVHDMWVKAKLMHDARTAGDIAVVELEPTEAGVAELHNTLKTALGE